MGNRLAGFFDARRLRTWSLAGQHALFALAPVLVFLMILRFALGVHAFGVDFIHGPWAAGGHVLAGVTPYADPHSAALRQGLAFVYPAAAAVVSIPFSILPHVPATVLFTAISAAAVILTLRLCGVVDWRVYGAVFLWPAVISGLQTDNLTLLIGLGLAVAWHYRDRPIVTGAILALLVSIKPFVWPLAFWLLATRRFRAAAWSIVLGLAINLVAWAIVGFAQFGRWTQVLDANAKDLSHQGYSPMTFFGGNSSPAALAVVLALAGALIAAAIILANRRQDRSAFALCLLASLIASPLVWLHYFALLALPLALARPRLSWWWLLPVLLWFPITSPSAWQVVAALSVACAVTLRALGSRSAHPVARPLRPLAVA